ncbi:MAG TPA: hypothetical protein EYH35_04415 [Thiotrichaceae bacterium]|nr:hypothetical protein [Thiotrichaceae bacterium]
MPIYISEDSSQIRIAVSVGGLLRQKYFHPKSPEAFKIDQKKAVSIEAEWKFEANIIAAQKNKERVEKRRNSAYVTGVGGIKMKFLVNTKNRPKRGAKTKRKRRISYYTPAFVVSGSQDGKLYCKNFNIKTQTYDMAWFNAVSYLCSIKGISHFEHLLRKRPPVEQFKVIINWQRKLGHNIPEERLPNELL